MDNIYLPTRIKYARRTLIYADVKNIDRQDIRRGGIGLLDYCRCMIIVGA